MQHSVPSITTKELRYSGNVLLLEAQQLQRCFGLLNEFLPFDPVSDAVLPVCYFHLCYIVLYIILPSIFRSS
jgi:hypothetical protein